jgi:hypothetical protein
MGALHTGTNVMHAEPVPLQLSNVEVVSRESTRRESSSGEGSKRSVRRTMSNGPAPSAAEQAATMARAMAAKDELAANDPNPSERRRGQSRNAKKEHTLVSFDGYPSDAPLRNIYAAEGEETEGENHWAVWVLEMGARGRNAAVAGYKLTADQTDDLKKASRRFKQKMAQRRYMQTKKETK